MFDGSWRFFCLFVAHQFISFIASQVYFLSFVYSYVIICLICFFSVFFLSRWRNWIFTILILRFRIGNYLIFDYSIFPTVISNFFFVSYRKRLLFSLLSSSVFICNILCVFIFPYWLSDNENNLVKVLLFRIYFYFFTLEFFLLITTVPT